MTYDDLDKLVITLDLPRLGELATSIVQGFCKFRGIEGPRLGKENEPVTAEGKAIALAAWDSVLFMADRRAFQDSVTNDLKDLPTT